MLPMPCDVPDDVELARLKSSELTRGLGGNADRQAISAWDLDDTMGLLLQLNIFSRV